MKVRIAAKTYNFNSLYSKVCTSLEEREYKVIKDDLFIIRFVKEFKYITERDLYYKKLKVLNSGRFTLESKNGIVYLIGDFDNTKSFFFYYVLLMFSFCLIILRLEYSIFLIFIFIPFLYGVIKIYYYYKIKLFIKGLLI